MYLGFDFYRDDSIQDLDERLTRINQFLSDKTTFDASYRRFGIFLLSPKKVAPTSSTFATYLAEKRSKSNYRLCIEFFENGNHCMSDLELIYELGKTPNIYNSMDTDVKFASFLCAYPEHAEVTFKKSDHSISILFNFKDGDPVIPTIQSYMKFLLLDKTQH